MVTVSDFINYLTKVKDKGQYIISADCGYKITSVLEQDGIIYIYSLAYDKPLSIRKLIDTLINIDKPNYEIKLQNYSIKFIIDWYTVIYIGTYNLQKNNRGTIIFRESKHNKSIIN